MSTTPASPLSKADYEKLSRFRYQLRSFLRLSEDLCRAHGLTALQYQLLLHVMGSPGKQWAAIGEIAEKLQAKHHGVVALIDRCERMGLVERRAGKTDRRQVEIHLMKKGRKLVEQLAILHQPELRLLRDAITWPGEGGTVKKRADKRDIA